MLIENMKATGRLDIVLTDSEGQVKDTREVKNLVVTTGLNFIASRMGGTSDAVMSHMGIGSGTTAAAAGDTALETQLDSRNALDSATVTNNEIVYVASFGAGEGTGAVTEAGVFNDATAGDMLCRTVFAAVNKADADSLTITWTVTISAS